MKIFKLILIIALLNEQTLLKKIDLNFSRIKTRKQRIKFMRKLLRGLKEAKERKLLGVFDILKFSVIAIGLMIAWVLLKKFIVSFFILVKNVTIAMVSKINTGTKTPTITTFSSDEIIYQKT